MTRKETVVSIAGTVQKIRNDDDDARTLNFPLLPDSFDFCRQSWRRRRFHCPARDRDPRSEIQQDGRRLWDEEDVLEGGQEEVQEDKDQEDKVGV